MMSYVNNAGTHTGICDVCRSDMPEGTPVIGVITGTITSYFDRDYSKAERVLCPDCSQAIGGVISVLGKRHRSSHPIAQEAA